MPSIMHNNTIIIARETDEVYANVWQNSGETLTKLEYVHRSAIGAGKSLAMVWRRFIEDSVKVWITFGDASKGLAYRFGKALGKLVVVR